jgi:hypothetical protein
MTERMIRERESVKERARIAHSVVGATTLGLQTKSGLRPNSRHKASLYTVGGQLPN